MWPLLQAANSGQLSGTRQTADVGNINPKREDDQLQQDWPT
jgi:hypothetical protein